MNAGFKSQCLPTYRVLTQDQINTLHCSTLKLLETIGVKIMHEEAIQMMADDGCRVKKDNIVQISNCLEEIYFTGSYALPFDSPTNLAYIDSFKAQLENSIKPIFYTAAGMEDMAVIQV